MVLGLGLFLFGVVGAMILGGVGDFGGLGCLSRTDLGVCLPCYVSCGVGVI